MNCRDFENIVSDLARGSAASPEVVRAGTAHAAVCHGCRSMLAVEKDLSGCLGVVAESDRSLQASGNAELALRRIYRQNQVVARQPASRLGWDRPGKSRRAAWALAAVAAVVIVATSIRPISRAYHNRNSAGAAGALQANAGNEKIGNTTANGQVAAPAGANSVNTAEGGLPTATKAPVKSHSARRRAGTDDMEEELLASDYMPLAADDELLGSDDLQVVRISLRKSALWSLGLPVSLETSNQLIQADVVVGEDGVPHAIKFVR